MLLSGLTLMGSYEALGNLEQYLGDGTGIKTHNANDGTFGDTESAENIYQ